MKETKQQTVQVLEDIYKIEKEDGREIQAIREVDIQISIIDLLLKDNILKGNEHFYKKEYIASIPWYDKALEIKPDYAEALNNKGVSLSYLKKFNESISYFDMALKINPDDALELHNKKLVQEN